MMGRRAFLTLGAASSSAVFRPAARAQQPAMPVVGYLSGGSAAEYAPMAAAFRRGLGEAGYAAGRNVTIEHLWADGRYDRLQELAAELVGRKVAVIAATGGVTSVLAAKAATSTIPIVFANGSDPLKFGVVASLNRPGGNVTGLTFVNNGLGSKRIQLLRELLNRFTTSSRAHRTPARASAGGNDMMQI